jgi:hypothetical protein
LRKIWHVSWDVPFQEILSQRQESNLRPTDYKSVALPAELLGHSF